MCSWPPFVRVQMVAACCSPLWGLRFCHFWSFCPLVAYSTFHRVGSYLTRTYATTDSLEANLHLTFALSHLTLYFSLHMYKMEIVIEHTKLKLFWGLSEVITCQCSEQCPEYAKCSILFSLSHEVIFWWL